MGHTPRRATPDAYKNTFAEQTVSKNNCADLYYTHSFIVSCCFMCCSLTKLPFVCVFHCVPILSSLTSVRRTASEAHSHISVHHFMCLPHGCCPPVWNFRAVFATVLGWIRTTRPYHRSSLPQQLRLPPSLCRTWSFLTRSNRVSPTDNRSSFTFPHHTFRTCLYVLR